MSSTQPNPDPTGQSLTLTRDCEANLVPSGTPVLLPRGSVAHVTQALGGAYTVMLNGSLARIDGRHADALGLAPLPRTDPGGPCADKSPVGDGSVDEGQVWEVLKTCYDPEIPINMVDLGLIYECQVTPLGEPGRNRVRVVMTLTAPGCGMGEFIAADVRTRIAAMDNVSEVDVELTFDPPWDQDRMSEAARLEAGLF
jgi:probable FeS assembly SUF system protein SufT